MFTNEEIHMDNIRLKESSYFATKYMQIKTTTKCHYSSIKLTKSKIVYGKPLVVKSEIIRSLMVGE